MDKPVIMLGAGGHSNVLIDCLKLQDRKIIGITVPDPKSKELFGIPVIGTDEEVYNYSFKEIKLVNGLGTIGSMEKRKNIYLRFKSDGYTFASVIHPVAIIASQVALEEGVQIMAGAIIQPGCHIGANSIINTKASVDHDCQIGSHVHLAPGVTLSGNCTVDNEVHVGTGATLIQGIKVESQGIIGAGAVVIRDVKRGSTVIGNPAREMNL